MLSEMLQTAMIMTATGVGAGMFVGMALWLIVSTIQTLFGAIEKS
jgi:hypothetical protein